MKKEEKKKNEMTGETAAPEVEKVEETVAEPAPETPSEEEKLKNELASLDDKYKRVLAEYDNFRKRSQKEREMFFGDGVAAAIIAILPLIDNLERAAAATGDDGIAKMLKQAQDILAKLHVEPRGREGEDFDPNFHNAVAHIEDENLGENVIAEVLQKGYVMNDRLIRPAMVKTAN